MFAPPDPSTPATPAPGPPAPPPPIPALPTMPTSGSAATLTLPVPATTPEPATAPLPVPAIESPQEQVFTPHLAAAPPIVHRPEVDASAADLATADTSDTDVSRLDERPAPPRRLFRTSWLRRLAIWGSVLAVPGAFVGDYIGAGLLVASLVALVVWSGVIATNVRRARLATRHGSAPHPLVVSLSWFTTPVVGLAASVGVGAVVAWRDSGTFDQEGSRTMVLAGAVFAAGVIVLIAMYQPYRILARCAKWANSDGGQFRKWFVAPIVAVLVAIVIQLFASLVVLTDGADGSSGTASVGAALVLIAAVALPWLAWLIFGSRAMRSLESGVANVHDRALRESQDPAAVNPIFAGQAAAAAVAASAVNVPSA